MEKTLQIIENSLKQAVDFSDVSFDEKSVQLGGIKDYIIRILTKSSLRIGALTDDIKKMIESKVEISIKNNLPIVLVPAVGGFKSHRTLSYPTIDFAELMQISYLIKNILPIAASYKPGVVVEYTLDSHALCLIDNYKEEDVDKYVEDFRALFAKVQSLLPSNVILKVTSFKDFYGISEIESEIEKRLSVARNESDYAQSVISRLDNARNDFNFNGRKDMSDLSESQINETLVDSVWRHKLWLAIDYEKRRDYLEGGERIPLLHRPFPGCLAIKSYNGSDIQFWVANGVYLIQDDEVSFKLITPNNSSVDKIERVELNEAFMDIPALKFVNIIKQP